MTIGLEYFRDWRATKLFGLLVQPSLNAGPTGSHRDH
jgi:hypothetical protein